MKSKEVRSRFLDFFSKRGHSILPSAPLIPENDPTVLFNTAGMQPLVPYLLGNPHPQGTRLADIQKCVRTTDIEDVGDKTHATFFEMMGNWSLGDYFKNEAIQWSYDFLTSKDEGLGLDPNRLYITVFEGDENSSKDLDSFEAWKKAGIKESRIYFKGADSNWWPAVKGKDSWTGPTGPCSEMFYDVTKDGLGDLTKEEFIRADEEQKVVEIWNDVFMEFEKKDGKIISKLMKKNVDTGAGFERLCAVLQGKDNIYDTDIFFPIMSVISDLAKKDDLRAKRIVADHIRASVMLIADGARPSNTDQGYVLRRLLRRAIRYSDKIGCVEGSLSQIAKEVINIYCEVYPDISGKSDLIISVISKEDTKFRETLHKGLKEFEKWYTKVIFHYEGDSTETIKERRENASKFLPGIVIFNLVTSHGFPLELIIDEAKSRNLVCDIEGFNREFEKHQALSRAGAEQKFKGGLGDTSEVSVKYHTATHLLHQALRDVLGDSVGQKGSNITPERLRFDFSFERKMTDDEKKKVEDIVNGKIIEALPVKRIELPREEALKTNALHFFADKYGDIVSIYFIGNSIETAYSKEFCGGPHVKNTSEIGSFKIVKEEAVSAGVRRIKAIIE